MGKYYDLEDAKEKKRVDMKKALNQTIYSKRPNGANAMYLLFHIQVFFRLELVRNSCSKRKSLTLLHNLNVHLFNDLTPPVNFLLEGASQYKNGHSRIGVMIKVPSLY